MESIDLLEHQLSIYANTTRNEILRPVFGHLR